MTNEIIAVEPNAKAIVARVTQSELAHAATNQFKSAIRSAISNGAELPVIVDLSTVEFLSSIALGALVELHLHMKRDGRRFVVIGMRPAIVDLFKLSGIDKLLEIHQGLDGALAQV